MSEYQCYDFLAVDVDITNYRRMVAATRVLSPQ
jgi:hypothetical protein